MTSGRISVILPAFNVETYIADTVASISAQTWDNIELIAVDDGSTDSTGTILHDLIEKFRSSGTMRRAIMLTQKNSGAGAARNTALGHATGDKIVFCDSDDLLDPTAFAKLSNQLDADPEICMAFPRCRHIDQKSEPLGVISPRLEKHLSAADLIRDNPIHSGTGVMLLKSAVARAGKFDEQLPACIDLDYWTAACRNQGECIVGSKEVLVEYRRRPNQITANWRRQHEGWSAVAEKAVETGTISRSDVKTARGINLVVWSTTAYQAGEFREARRLIVKAFLNAPIDNLFSSSARMRFLACISSLLPRTMHVWISNYVNR